MKKQNDWVEAMIDHELDDPICPHGEQGQNCELCKRQSEIQQLEGLLEETKGTLSDVQGEIKRIIKELQRLL